MVSKISGQFFTRLVPLFLLLLVCQPAQAGKKIILERILATVNSEIILESDWRQRFEAMTKRLARMQRIPDNVKQKQLKKLPLRILKSMVQEKLLIQAARVKQISVTEAEIVAQMERTRKRFRLTPAQFRLALQQQGYTLSSYRTMLQQQLQKMKLTHREVRMKIRITENDIQAEYKRLSRGVDAGPTEYNVQHIVYLVPKKAKPAQIKEIRRKAGNGLKAALLNPKQFTSLAKRLSEGPFKSNGGSLGFVKKSEIDPALGMIMVQMKAGTVHPRLLRSPMGFHVLYLRSKRSSGIASIGDVRAKIKAQLTGQAYQRQLRNYVNKLRKSAVIKYRIKVLRELQIPTKGLPR
jgi:peptidyl-prolyl cis-trans isomerase SurA